MFSVTVNVVRNGDVIQIESEGRQSFLLFVPHIHSALVDLFLGAGVSVKIVNIFRYNVCNLFPSKQDKTIQGFIPNGSYESLADGIHLQRLD